MWTIDTTKIKENPIIDTYIKRKIIKEYKNDWLSRIVKISTYKQKTLNMIKVNSCTKYYLEGFYRPTEELYGDVDEEVAEQLKIKKKTSIV